MIVVVVDTAMIAIAGHASSKVACAAVSSVAMMLRHRAAVFHCGVHPVPSLVVVQRDASELVERAIDALRVIATEHKTHVRFKRTSCRR